jgi:hypothetical protein
MSEKARKVENPLGTSTTGMVRVPGDNDPSLKGYETPGNAFESRSSQLETAIVLIS